MVRFGVVHSLPDFGYKNFVKGSASHFYPLLHVRIWCNIAKVACSRRVQGNISPEMSIATNR